SEMIQKYEEQLKAVREIQKGIEEEIAPKNGAARGRMLAYIQQHLAGNEGDLLTARKQLRQAQLELAILKAREKALPQLKVSEQEVAAALAEDPEISEARA